MGEKQQVLGADPRSDTLDWRPDLASLVAKYSVVSTIEDDHFVRVFPSLEAALTFACDYIKDRDGTVCDAWDDIEEWAGKLGISEWFFVEKITHDTAQPSVMTNSNATASTS